MFSPIPRLLILLATAAHLTHFAGEVESPSAKAGWAEVDITPTLGIALGGRGGPQTLAARVLDPLKAQVLLLKDRQGNGFVLVSFDLVGLPADLSDRIRTDIVQETGVSWNLVVLNTSHTHSGPYMLRSLIAGVGPAPKSEIEYFQSLRDKIRLATRTAGNAMKAVRVEVFEGTSQLAINRRGTNAQGERAMIPDPTGPYDQKVWVLQLTPVNGDPPAVLFSYACHPVIVYGFAPAAISADFPGSARSSLRQALGSKTHFQFVQGFGGDVRPRLLAEVDKRRFRTGKPAELEQAGKELADDVQRAMRSPGESLILNIAGDEDRPFLPRADPPPREFYEKLRSAALARSNTFHVAVSDYWLERYARDEGFARGDAWSAGVIRLADNQWVVHLGGEPCVGWRSKISAWLAPRKVVSWGYCQQANTYLPTESMLPEGGYEVLESNQARANSPAPFATGIENGIRESLLRQLAFIEAAIPSGKATASPR